jgi:hypothetical protein
VGGDVAVPRRQVRLQIDFRRDLGDGHDALPVLGVAGRQIDRRVGLLREQIPIALLEKRELRGRLPGEPLHDPDPIVRVEELRSGQHAAHAEKSHPMDQVGIVLKRSRVALALTGPGLGRELGVGQLEGPQSEIVHGLRGRGR